MVLGLYSTPHTHAVSLSRQQLNANFVSERIVYRRQWTLFNANRLAGATINFVLIMIIVLGLCFLPRDLTPMCGGERVTQRKHATIDS
jgi:hypothetical protein